MSNEAAKALAEVVKSVHRHLRQELKKNGDPESVWSKHCENETSLMVIKLIEFIIVSSDLQIFFKLKYLINTL